jgi:hypothetical protein
LGLSLSLSLSLRLRLHLSLRLRLSLSLSLGLMGLMGLSLGLMGLSLGLMGLSLGLMGLSLRLRLCMSSLCMCNLGLMSLSLRLRLRLCMSSLCMSSLRHPSLILLHVHRIHLRLRVVPWMHLYLRLRMLLQYMLPSDRLHHAYLLHGLYGGRRRLGGIAQLGCSSFGLRPLWCDLDDVNGCGLGTVWCWGQL